MSSPTSFSVLCAALETAPCLAFEARARGDARKCRRGFRNQSPEPLHEAVRAFDAGLGPDHVAVGRRIRQHEPARRIGAVAGDDVVGIDDILLRLRHLLDRADLDRRAVRDQRRAALAVDLLDLDLGRRHPAVRALVGLVHDHALREQALERLLDRVQMAGDLHGADEEARIEQVQDRVLDAADILVDRQPAALAVDAGQRRSALLVPRVGEAREIPGRIDERVHRVGVAARLRLPHCGQADMLPARMMVERIARLVEGRRRPAAAPADRCPAPAPRRNRRNGSPGSGSPSSAGARSASRAGGTAPCARPSAGCRSTAARAAAPLRRRPAFGFMPSRKRELIITPSST